MAFDINIGGLPHEYSDIPATVVFIAACRYLRDDPPPFAPALWRAHAMRRIKVSVCIT